MIRISFTLVVFFLALSSAYGLLCYRGISKLGNPDDDHVMLWKCRPNENACVTSRNDYAMGIEIVQSCRWLSNSSGIPCETVVASSGKVRLCSCRKDLCNVPSLADDYCYGKRFYEGRCYDHGFKGQSYSPCS